MSKWPWPVNWRPVADTSPTIPKDPAWRALYTAYQKWFLCQREAKQKRVQKMTSGHRRSPSIDEECFR